MNKEKTLLSDRYPLTAEDINEMNRHASRWQAWQAAVDAYEASIPHTILQKTEKEKWEEQKN